MAFFLLACEIRRLLLNNYIQLQFVFIHGETQEQGLF